MFLVLLTGFEPSPFGSESDAVPIEPPRHARLPKESTGRRQRGQQQVRQRQAPADQCRQVRLLGTRRLAFRAPWAGLHDNVYCQPVSQLCTLTSKVDELMRSYSRHS